MTKTKYQANPRGGVTMFNPFISIRRCTFGSNLRSCVSDLHELWQSQIMINQKILPMQFVILSQFVIHAIWRQFESNHKEKAFCVLGRVPLCPFDMNLRSGIFVHFGVIWMLYTYVCVSLSLSIYINYNG